MNAITDFWRRNVDTKLVVSSVVATATFGALVYVAGKSGVGPLKTVAKVAQGK